MGDYQNCAFAIMAYIFVLPLLTRVIRQGFGLQARQMGLYCSQLFGALGDAVRKYHIFGGASTSDMEVTVTTNGLFTSDVHMRLSRSVSAAST